MPSTIFPFADQDVEILRRQAACDKVKNCDSRFHLSRSMYRDAAVEFKRWVVDCRRMLALASSVSLPLQAEQTPSNAIEWKRLGLALAAEKKLSGGSGAADQSLRSRSAGRGSLLLLGTDVECA